MFSSCFSIKQTFSITLQLSSLLKRQCHRNCGSHSVNDHHIDFFQPRQEFHWYRFGGIWSFAWKASAISHSHKQNSKESPNDDLSFLSFRLIHRKIIQSWRCAILSYKHTFQLTPMSRKTNHFMVIFTLKFRLAATSKVLALMTTKRCNQEVGS